MLFINVNREGYGNEEENFRCNLVVVLLFSLTSCGEQEQVDFLNQQIAELQTQKSSLEVEITDLENMVAQKKEENGTAKYILTLEIKQTHFTLKISEHLKDAMNAIEIQIPVDKEYYDSVEVGQNIADEFRMGSLVFKGTFGNFKVSVIKKEIQ